MKHLLPATALLLALCSCTAARQTASAPANPAWQKELAAYNLVWTTPSKNAAGSMPLSGGILGLNVWVQDGDICFLMGSPNCMDENGMQTKLGLVKVRFSPAVFDRDFKQELRLGQSEIVISGKTAAGSPVSVKLWCGVDQPVVHMETSSGEPVDVTATYETWSSYQAQVKGGALVWSRRLAEVNARRQRDMKAQGMAEFADKIPDPLSGLTTGGRMTAPGMVDAGTGTGSFNGMKTKTCALKTAVPVKQLDLCLTLRMEQDKSQSDWEAQLNADAKRAETNGAADRAAALAWWEAFWNRSHISIHPGAGESDKAWTTGRHYQFIRYLYAANIRGRAMTLFNGGPFPCTGNPDRREWDGCQFMAQNQRLSSWPMLRSGDFDILKVATDFYRDRTEMSRLHAQKFWGVDGVAWSEPFSIFGMDAIGTNADGRSRPSHLPYHYTSGMEFALLMLEMNRYTGQDHPRYRDAALGILRYFDQFNQKSLNKKTGKPLDDKGRLVIYPSDACEPYHGCTNATDTIAGLTALSRELLAGTLTAQERAYVEGFVKRIPAFPMQEKDGRRYFAAADSWEWVFTNTNMDFPQMYVCFPFNILSLGRSDMSLAKNTWDLAPVNPAVQHQNHAWYQSAINFARMGDTTMAARYILEKMHHSSARFPTFYRTFYLSGAPNFNHTPDMDHCGTAMTALQEMLMQTDGRRILLGAAWPAQWSGDFKLHAPYQTTVEGHIANGKVIVDRVVPESRRKDIEIFPLKALPPPPPPSLAQGKKATASSTYRQAGYGPEKAVDGDPKTRWAAADGQKTGWLEVDFGQPTAVSRAIIMEKAYPAATKFTIEAQAEIGEWREAAGGTTIGSQREVKFTAVTARKFRLVIKEASSMPNIEEFQLFDK